jgi:hypothetical protein
MVMERLLAINQLVAELNKQLDCKFNSCLISHYTSGDISIPPHSDDERLIDQEHTICNISMGMTRTIDFYKNPNSNTPAFSQKLENCSMLLMLPGCQQHYKHGISAEIPSEDSSSTSPVRFCLSFRKLVNPVSPAAKQQQQQHLEGPPKLEQEGYQAQSPIPPQLGNMVHASRQHDMVHESMQHNTPQVQAHMQPGQGTTAPSNRNRNRDGISTTIGKIQVVSDTNTPEHVIIGDSLTRNITLPGCITITQGGCHPKDIPRMLYTCNDVFPVSQYTNIKSVTLCAGTNPVSHFQLPLLAIVGDYNKLVCDIMGQFPNATVGFFNIPPRVLQRPFNHHVSRINTFNGFLQDFTLCYKNTKVISCFWEYITREGFLDLKYYARDHLHMNEAGKSLMRNSINRFQSSLKRS